MTGCHYCSGKVFRETFVLIFFCISTVCRRYRAEAEAAVAYVENLESDNNGLLRGAEEVSRKHYFSTASFFSFLFLLVTLATRLD